MGCYPTKNFANSTGKRSEMEGCGHRSVASPSLLFAFSRGQHFRGHSNVFSDFVFLLGFAVRFIPNDLRFIL